MTRQLMIRFELKEENNNLIEIIFSALSNTDGIKDLRKSFSDGINFRRPELCQQRFASDETLTPEGFNTPSLIDQMWSKVSNLLPSIMIPFVTGLMAKKSPWCQTPGNLSKYAFRYVSPVRSPHRTRGMLGNGIVHTNSPGATVASRPLVPSGEKISTDIPSDFACISPA